MHCCYCHCWSMDGKALDLPSKTVTPLLLTRIGLALDGLALDGLASAAGPLPAKPSPR